MGWRGATRSLIAAARKAEREQHRRQRQSLREQQRHQRDLIKHQKVVARHLESAHAAQVVAEHEAFVRRLVTAHLNGSAMRNWQAVAHSHPPPQPQYLAHHEQQALHALQTFKPGVADRLLGGAAAKRKQLEQAVAAARQVDQATHEQAVAHYQQSYQRWEWESGLARAIVAGDLEAHQTAVEHLFPVADIPELSDIAFDSNASWYVDATMELHSDDDLMPDEYPTQLKSGKLSWKQIPKGRYNELFQDHICSCALRIAWELFALLPISTALVHVMMDLLDTATGHMHLVPVLSVAFVRPSLLELNPDRLDPSDAMSNFLHNMNFSSRTGFKPVEKLSAEALSPPSHGSA